MSEAEIRERLGSAVRPAFEKSFDPAADLARGRRRRRRNQAVGGTATCAAVAAAAALVVPALPWGAGESDGVASAAADGVVYVADDRSVIHVGDREIDVSPHEIASFTQTDDGFVFVVEDWKAVYFTDGDAIERIGRPGWESDVVSDDTGSYVAWIAPTSETVVYDTSRGVVARLEIGDRKADLPPIVADIDGDVVYVRQRGVGLAWDFEADDSVRSSAALSDVSDGYLARMYRPPASAYPQRVVVSPDPDADRPRFPALEGPPADGMVDLSPSGRYIADVVSVPTVLDRTTQRDVAPVVDSGYADFDLGYWLDDDRYVLRAYRPTFDPSEAVVSRPSDLLVCSVSGGACEVSAESVGRQVTFPR